MKLRVLDPNLLRSSPHYPRLFPLRDRSDAVSFGALGRQLHAIDPLLQKGAVAVIKELNPRFIVLYAGVITKAIEIGLRRELELLTDVRNVPFFEKYMFAPDSILDRITWINGIPFSDSAIINRLVHSTAQEAVVTEAIHSYSFFERELALLTTHAVQIVEHISPINDVVDLGPGIEKSSVILNALALAGKSPQALHLVDSNATALDTTFCGLLKKTRYNGAFVRKYLSFEELLIVPLPQSLDSKRFVINLGTTFGNMMPEMNFAISTALNVQHMLIGIYTYDRTKEHGWSILSEYASEEMRDQSIAAATIFGISHDELETKTNYRVTLFSIDLSEQYGAAFERVCVLATVFDIAQTITTGLGITLEKGNAIGGFYSIKYTDEQFRLLAQLYHMNIQYAANDRDVALYLLERTTL